MFFLPPRPPFFLALLGLPRPLRLLWPALPYLHLRGLCPPCLTFPLPALPLPLPVPPFPGRLFLTWVPPQTCQTLLPGRFSRTPRRVSRHLPPFGRSLCPSLSGCMEASHEYMAM